MTRIKNILRLGFLEFQDQYYQGVAAQLAFFLFLSILPMVTMLSQLLGLFSLSLDELQAWANINISGTGLETIQSFLSVKTANLGTNLILIVVTLWSASKAQYSMTSIADYVFKDLDAPSAKSGIVWRRLRSLVHIIVIIAILVCTIAFAIYLPQLLNILLGPKIAMGILHTVWIKMRWLVVLTIYFATVSLIYYMTPTKKMTLRMILPGSIFSSIGFIAVSLVYGTFTNMSGNNIIYGSLSNVVFFLIWLWYVAWVLCLGLVLIKVWHNTIE